MKRIIFVILCIILTIAYPIGSLAIENVMNEEIFTEYLEDGSYIVTEITIYQTKASGTINANKKINYYNGDDELQWVYKLNGTFTYTGSSSTCTYANNSVTIYNSAWKTYSASATRSGNSAYGNVTMKYYHLGAVLSTVQRSVTLTCDANGNLS